MNDTVRPRKGPQIKELVSTQTFAFKRDTNPQAALQQAPVITPQQGDGKSYAEQNPEYVSVSLPSHFQPYPFKSLSLRTLQGIHQAKFNRAHTENRIRFTVEAISSTLEPGISAFDLTPSDFYFLMYWQKVNSFSKSPQLIEHFCTDKDHNIAVAKGEKDRDSLRTEEILNSTTLDTKYADRFDFAALNAGLEKYDIGFETMRDVVELAEFIQDAEDNVTEFVWLAEYASFLKRKPGQETLEERAKIVAQMSPEEIELLDRYMEVVTDYGVDEFATIKCRGCGASTKLKLSFDALSFLPNTR